MARILSEWPEGKAKQRARVLYKWAEWFDGRIWELGVEDWGGDVSAFRNAAWRYAQRIGGTCRIKRCNANTMAIQFLEKGSVNGDGSNERGEQLSTATNGNERTGDDAVGGGDRRGDRNDPCLGVG